jgi:pyruvyltransferase
VEVLRRFEKLRRFARWRFIPGRLPVWWHVGRPNFGDDINPVFFHRLAGLSTCFAADRSRPHVLGAGSILEHAGGTSVVCGAGFLRPPARSVAMPSRLVSVRGELSRAAFPRAGAALLGDPLVLVSEFVSRQQPRHRFGLVPHVLSVGRWQAWNSSRLRIIDPAASPWRVVREIASCEVVLSQSLHGLIVADALGIPNVWVAPSDGMAGGRFKFDDYFSTLDAAKTPVPETADLFANPSRYAATVGRYLFSKADYRTALAAACADVAGQATSGRRHG